MKLRGRSNRIGDDMQEVEDDKEAITNEEYVDAKSAFLQELNKSPADITK